MASLSTIFKFWTLLSVTRTMASTSTGPNNTHTPFTSDVNIQDEAHRLVVETCLKLHTHQPNLVTLPCHNKDQFNHLSTQNWSQTVWQQPACVATPTCAADVSLLIKTLVQAKVPFAIRSGGHSPNRGDASIDGAGVLLSLHRLNHITYDAGTKLASIGPGARWDDVYTELDKYNVTVVGGRVMSVGVGGLVLGGGLSYLSDVHGLVCDNIVAYEVVLADGNIVEASETSHSDLFWALKGGGNNFGVVTRLVMQTFPAPQAWGGLRVFGIDQMVSLMQAGRGRRGGNALGLEAVEQTWWSVSAAWASADDDDVVDGAVCALRDKIDALVIFCRAVAVVW